MGGFASMIENIDVRRPLHRALAVLAATVVATTMAVTGPAAAQSAPDAVDQPDVTTSDTTTDVARVPSGLDVEVTAVASNFNAAYIISDYAFFNRTAMSEAEIQAFLEARISGPCTTAYCLMNYSMTTPDRNATARCNGYTGGTNESAARIIYKVQLSCGVSAKVLLVTLQKEQSLVSNPGPSLRTLERAMGYYCPDDPAQPGWCHPDFAGFFNQTYNAAGQFQRYRLNPTGYNFRPGSFNIQYHPNTSCGTKSVTIRNQATAGLYNYTPYTPNAAAMSNLYGTGDACSSYGNRNFWRLYTDWFGSPTTLVPSGVETVRLAGSDRWSTAALISADTYPNGASTVFVAVGSTFPDGLAAAPAAALVDAPLLLVGSTTVPTATATELQRLAPSKIVIVGGTGVVTAAVESRLRQLVPAATIDRYFGADRYATAANIATRAFVQTQVGAKDVFLATGAGFADALAASAAAGSMGAAVLLVRPSATALNDETRALIQSLGATRVIIAGGEGAVSNEVQQSAGTIPGVTSVVRFGGADRYATASLVNNFAFPTAQRGLIASGRDFPDALAAAAAAGALNAPLHLSNGTCTRTVSLQHLVDAGVTRVAFVGGTGVLGSTVTEFLTCG